MGTLIIFVGTNQVESTWQIVYQDYYRKHNYVGTMQVHFKLFKQVYFFLKTIVYFVRSIRGLLKINVSKPIAELFLLQMQRQQQALSQELNKNLQLINYCCLSSYLKQCFSDERNIFVFIFLFVYLTLSTTKKKKLIYKDRDEFIYRYICSSKYLQILLCHLIHKK